MFGHCCLAIKIGALIASIIGVGCVDGDGDDACIGELSCEFSLGDLASSEEGGGERGRDGLRAFCCLLPLHL